MFSELLNEYRISCDSISCQRVLLAIGAIGSIWLIKKFLDYSRIKKKIKRKQTDINARKVGLLQKFQGMKLPLENMITVCGLSGRQLHERISSGELSPVDVLEAYQAGALFKNNKLNFLADIIYEADVSSLMIDREHCGGVSGFPMAVSDSLSVYRYDCTLGLVREIHRPAEKDCLIVQVLREAGAIPAIITSVGQGELVCDTSNPITGRVVNPFNPARTCGGSAGGQAVSLATESALIGIAGDIFGNIRIPCSFCGVFGLKPTTNRISKRHTKTVGFHQNIIETSIGPLARNIDDLIELFKSMVCERMFQLDPNCSPVPFNEELFSKKKKLKLGFYVHIGGNQMPPVPAVERAVLLAKRALEKAGHELIEYHLPTVDKITSKVYQKIVYSDGGKSTLSDVLKRGPIDSSIKPHLCMLKLPSIVKRCIGSFVGWFCRNEGDRLSGLNGVSSVYELWKLKDEIEDYREQTLTSWEQHGLDGLICPVLPIVAPPIGSSHCLLQGNAYSVIFNILGYPAGSVPVTQVNESDIDQLKSCYSKKSKCCQMNVKSQADSIGLPVGVQCVSLPWRDETALIIMKDLADNL